MPNQWLEHLQTLLNRFDYLGLNADIGALTLIELHGIYCYLSRLASN
jgi:hypothetical protein